MASTSPTPNDNNDNARYLQVELRNRMQTEPELFDWIQSAALDGLWYWDLENPSNEWMSRELKALFGYTDEEVPNTPQWWQDNIFPEDKLLALEAFNNHVTKGTPYSLIVRYRHKDGSTVWVRCRGKALFNDQGKPVRMLGAHNDLTPLMKVQDELRKKEAVLDLLCTTALDGFWDWNMNTGEDFLSKRWKKALGYEDDELANTVETWMSLLHPDDLPKAMDAVKRHMDEGAEYNVVLRYKRKDGTWAHMKAQGVAQKDENGNWARMFGTHTDVSYLEEARAAREASEAKSVFLATMSHEIRTPLNAVLGMAQVLMTTQLTEEQEECVTILQNSGAHLLSLINDILDLSQIESGVISLAKEEFSIQTSVVSVLDVFLLQARQRGIALTFETHVPAGTLFCGDSERICQVLFNLVGNALKFTAAGSVDVVVSTKQVNNISGVLFEVHDTGCGMTKDQQGLIFDQFRQASNEIRRKYGGSGLGLSISKKLVAAMSGTLTVESELDRGSTFTMWLPDNIDPGDQPRAHPLVSTVLLYEAPILADNTSKTFLSSGIKAAGRDVHHVWEAELFESAFDKFSPDTIVVATRPNSRDSALDDVLSFLRTVLDRNPALLVIGIDKSLSKWDVSGNFKAEQICRLPLFPTSNEFKEAFDTRRLKESPTLAKHIEEVASNCRMNPLRVLVAEDIVINQKVIVKLLSRLPCIVDIANDGAEAVELAGMHKYDLILMDCVMPVMDGLEATRIIRRRDKTTPIVALTANATTDDRRTCLQAGCSDFIPKPVSFDLLCTIFAKISKNSAAATAAAAAAENGVAETPFRQEQEQQMNHVSST